MITLTKSGATWWRKPLVLVQTRPIPAELAILRQSLNPREEGVWLNSRSTRSGVVDLLSENGRFKTVRKELPQFVQSALQTIYSAAGVLKGCPDLVIWNSAAKTFRLVEVKCPHWDRPTLEQEKVISAAIKQGVECTIAEWEFTNPDNT